MQASAKAGHQKTDLVRQAIMNEDYKKAIKLASKLEKNEVARAMQAYALERLGRRDEALAICEQLRTLSDLDSTVFTWIMHVYMMAKQHRELAQMHSKAFEAASVKQADHYFYLGQQVFEGLTRCYDFAEAQTHAMRLARANTSGALDVTKVWLWVSTLAFIRAPLECSPDDLNLNLAEAFFTKAAAAAKPEAHLLALPLKRWILLRRNKVDEAIASLAFHPDESPSAKVWTRALLLRVKGDEASARSEFSILLEMIKSIAEARDDHRTFARLARLAAQSIIEREGPLRDVLNGLVVAEPKLRGPLLGLIRLELELFFASSLANESVVQREAIEIRLKDSILSFIKAKGDLACAFSDLQNDLIVFMPQTGQSSESIVTIPPGERVLPAALVCPFTLPAKQLIESDRDSRRWPVEHVLQFRVSEKTRTSFVEELVRDGRLVAYQVLRYIGHHGENDLWRTFATKAMDTSLSQQERDDWGLLAAHVLVDYGDANFDPCRLMTAMAVLQNRIAESQDNFQLRLALNEVAGHRLGAGRVAWDAFKGLRVKQIQLDAIGYIGAADLSSLALFDEALEFAQSVCDFNSRGRGETAECFAEAFRHVESSSPVEVLRLENRLRDSFQFNLSIVERTVLSLFVPPPKEDGDDGLARKSQTIFSRLKVEVEDPAKGESQVSLPEHRLALVIKKLDDLRAGRYCFNLDLDVQSSFDPHMGRGYLRELKTIKVFAEPNSRIPKECGNNKKFIEEWSTKSINWLVLRTLLVSSLIVVPNKQRLEEMKVIMEDIGLMTRSDRTSPLWDLALDSLHIFTSGKIDTVLEEKFQMLEGRWTAVSELAQAFRLDPRRFIADISIAMQHAGLVVHAVLSRINVAYKKSQKDKSAKFPYDASLFNAVRQAATKALQRLGASLNKLCEIEIEFANDFIVPDGLAVGVAAAQKSVKASHVESLKRVASLANTFATHELQSL